MLPLKFRIPLNQIFRDMSIIRIFHIPSRFTVLHENTSIYSVLMKLKNEFSVGKYTIGESSRPFLAAEIGLNHNNDPEIGKRTIAAAAKAGADAVKFQSYVTHEFIDSRNSEAKFLFDIFKKYELSEKLHREFQKTAESEGVIFFSTPLCEGSVDLLLSMNVPVIKIASGDIVNYPLLKKTAETGLPVFLSSGAADFYEVTRAMEFLSASVDRICLMHCLSMYPAPPEKLNLRTLELYKEIYECPLGFSDHSAGTLGAALSVGLGASVIEKHFTLDKNLPGPDHQISASPDELKKLREDIDTAFRMRGEKVKRPTAEEAAGRFYGRRSAYVQNSRLTALRPALHARDSAIADSWDIKDMQNNEKASEGAVRKFTV